MFRAAAIGITVALATTTVHARASGQAFAGQVFGFGDSLVDNGNIPRITGQDVPRSPPYFHGRYSNGPTFVEGLPGLLGMGWRDSNDLAIGGATSGQTVNGGPGLPGFSAQLAQFAANGGRFSAADLPVTWVGANDYIAAARAHAFELLFGDDAERRAIFEPVVREAVTNIAQGVGGMFGLGARRAVVIGLPPLGKAPIMSGGPMEAMADGISAAHNKALLEGLKQVNARTGMNIYFVNADMAFRMFLADPKRYGFDDAVNACLGDPACARASTDVQNRHIFFDDLHPTASTHRLIARIIANQVSAGAGLDRPGKSSLAATDAFSRAILWGSARRTAPVRPRSLPGRACSASPAAAFRVRGLPVAATASALAVNASRSPAASAWTSTSTGGPGSLWAAMTFSHPAPLAGRRAMRCMRRCSQGSIMRAGSPAPRRA